MPVNCAPHRVVGNLRFTDNGVFAEYLLSGLPFIFLSAEWQHTVAEQHAELNRTLPSGAQISGLTVPVSTHSMSRKLLFANPDGRDWIQYCRQWEPAIAAQGGRRRLYWLSIPLDFGLAGDTQLGRAKNITDIVIGKDKDTATSVAHYRALAAEMVDKLPPVFFPKPVTVEQIWWHWNYSASRSAWRHPFPSQPFDPDAALPGSAFRPAFFDESDAARRGRRWRAARADSEAFVRVFRDPVEQVADCYQTFLPLIDFPDAGLAFPRSTVFKVLDDLTRAETTLDWTMHLSFQDVDAAVATSQTVVTNIRDQFLQRGRHADTDDELLRKLASGIELTSQLKSGGDERGLAVSLTVVAASTSREAMNQAAATVTQTYRRQGITTRRWRGGQTAQWAAFLPGRHRSGSVEEFRNPTTATRFARFVPLLGAKLGNNTGVPLGMTLTSGGLRDVVLLDLLRAPQRSNGANLAIVGSPGRGKSLCVKGLARSWLLTGAGVHLFDPTDAREHSRALADIDGTIVIDLADPWFTVDPLRIFNGHDAGDYALDHLLPLLGYSPLSRAASRLRAHLSPESRSGNGIGDLNTLIGFLRDLRGDGDPSDADLLVGLEGLRSERHLRALFDQSLPVADFGSAHAVIWNTAGLRLPTVTEEYQAHLHQLTTSRQRAGQAIYGLAADLSQSIFFNRPERNDVLIVEECAAWTNSPAGQRCANTIIRQGRKANTAFVGVSQHPIKDFHTPLEDELIDQRLCLGFRDPGLARATLQWCHRDLDRHPDLLTDYVENTSPPLITDHGDDTIDTSHGKVIPGREGEAWYLDEFGGWGKVALFAPPDTALMEAFDTTPPELRRPGGRRRAPQSTGQAV